MKKIVNVIILTVFWSILFAPLYLLFRKSNIMVTAFIAAFYFIFLFVSISYKHFWSFKTLSTKKGIIKFFVIVFASFLMLLYLTNLVFISHEAYEFLMKGNKTITGFDDIEYQADDTLGLKPVPNARTLYKYDTLDKIPTPQIPIVFDNDGFRIPLSDVSKDNKSHKINLLFLGDSFTFGAACYAEETFPFLVAKETHLSYINAGVSNYGLAQMLILAEKLIPEFKPDYVIVQYSPWLVSRGAWVFAPVNYMLIPTPYFAKKNNDYFLEPPVYNNHFDFRNIKRIKSSYQGKFIKFLFKEAFPFSLYEIRNFLKTKFLLMTGQRLRPATNLPEAERYAYNKIKTIAEKNGASVIILNLGDIEYSGNSHSLFSTSNIKFAEADYYLNEFLKTSASKDYYTEFCHWIINGNNRILIDFHPNPKAHRIIAGSIIKELNKIKK